jgi:hypothetical protein
MLKELAVDFFTIVPGAATFGVLFDTIIPSNSPRKLALLRIFDEASAAKWHPRDTLIEFIKFANLHFFDRVFGPAFLSWSYFLRASILSLLLLTLVVAVQYIHSPEPFHAISFTTMQVVDLAICIAGNCVVDWVSIGLTQMLFRVSAAAGNVWHSLVLILLDMVVTINVFILVYSLPLTLVLLAANLTGATYKATATKYFGPPADPFAAFLLTKLSGDLPGHPNGISYYFSDNRLNAAMESYEGLLIGSSVSAVSSDPIPIRLHDVVNTGTSLGVSASPSDLWARAWIPSSDRKGKLLGPDKLLTVHNLTTRSPELKALIKNSTTSYFEDAIITVRPSLFSLREWYDAYSASYFEASNVRMDFPEDVSYVPQFIKISELLRYENFQMANAHKFRISCNDRLGRHIVVSSTDLPLPRQCKSWVAMHTVGILGLKTAILTQYGSLADVQLPMNSVFLTSLGTTFFAYSFLLTIVSASILFTYVVKVFGLGEIFQLAPFTMSSALLGLVTFFLVEFLG